MNKKVTREGKWEERSITQLCNFDKKTRVPVLALELAYKIENDKI